MRHLFKIKFIFLFLLPLLAFACQPNKIQKDKDGHLDKYQDGAIITGIFDAKAPREVFSEKDSVFTNPCQVLVAATEYEAGYAYDKKSCQHLTGRWISTFAYTKYKDAYPVIPILLRPWRNHANSNTIQLTVLTVYYNGATFRMGVDLQPEPEQNE